MTREQLKVIIKECLVELLQEGLGSSVSSNTSKPVYSSPLKTEQKTVQRKPAAAPVKAVIPEMFVPSEDSKIMQEIFAHTMATTVAKQPKNDLANNSSQVISETLMDHTPLNEAFGAEMAGKWEQIAERLSGK